MAVRLRYEIHGTPRQFWEAFFDPRATTTLHLEALGSTSISIDVLVGDPQTGVERIVTYSQSLDAPEPVKRLFGAEVTVVEHGRFDAGTNVWTFTVTAGTPREGVDVKGSIEILEADPDPAGAANGTGGASEMIFSLDARARMLGAGPVVERLVERQACEVQDRATAFFNGMLGNETRGAVGAGSAP